MAGRIMRQGLHIATFVPLLRISIHLDTALYVIEGMILEVTLNILP